ncbi:MAG: hypothetical protein WC378_14985, partial [Opitutaceae bacterium]
MPPPDIVADGDAGEIPADLAGVGIYPDEHAAFERSVVLVATGHACWLVASPPGFRVLVEPASEASARWQIASYERECAVWPPRPAAVPPPLRLEYVTPLLWALAVVGSFYIQVLETGRWEELGALDSMRIFGHGEFWRPLTALFLHADGAHLCGNLVTGIFVFATV